MQLTLLHNPNCSKSRQAVQLLEEANLPFAVRHYLENSLNADELTSLLDKLGCSAQELARKGEDIYKELQLAEADNQAVIAAMVAHPRLIERPVLIAEKTAVVGRPPENVLELAQQELGN